MSSSTGEIQYLLYPQSVALPILAFPAWILCISPMFWHLSQRNIAAGSLILWIILLNFFNFINPLIWPRDNVEEWYNGAGLCDIEARIQVGATVALAACTAVIARRLANVMDTRNITVIPSKRSVLIEKILEIGFCWVYPAIIMIMYYVVQPFRYFIFGISGCTAAYDSSWPSLVIVWIWGCITTLVAAFYSGLLGFRLFHYRREFHGLITARNTTKSRFIRLFIMALYVSIILLPYSFFILYQLSGTIVDEFSWARVHGSNWNSVVKVPSNGSARWDRWGEVGAGYVTFILFGTGTDANNTYKRMLTSIGLGKIFSRLYIKSESSCVQTPSSVTFVKQWTSNWSSKAKSLLSKNGSISEPSHNASFIGSAIQPLATNEESAILPPHSQHNESYRTNTLSFFSRIFSRHYTMQSILPIHSKTSTDTDRLPALDKTPSNPSIFTACVWAADSVSSDKNKADKGVHVVHEVHQAGQNKGKEKATDQYAWA